MKVNETLSFPYVFIYNFDDIVQLDFLCISNLGYDPYVILFLYIMPK